MENIKDKITNAVGEAVGAAAATGIGMAAAGPAGAVAGATIGSIISSIGSDILSRLLSKREKERIDRVNNATIKKIEENRKAGKTLRDDGFFSNSIDDRSSAEEIYEGILLASQKEYEERKIELLGRLFANIAYDSNISRPIANALIKEASELTYRQLMIIKDVGILQIAAATGLDSRRQNNSGEVSGLTNVSIASDIVTLYHKTLVQSSSVILDAANINPAVLTLVGNGALLFDLMELQRTEIDDSEKEIMEFLTKSL
mgnify:CR=1 FL=1